MSVANGANVFSSVIHDSQTGRQPVCAARMNLTEISDLDLFGDGKGIVNFNA